MNLWYSIQWRSMGRRKLVVAFLTINILIRFS